MGFRVVRVTQGESTTREAVTLFPERWEADEFVKTRSSQLSPGGNVHYEIEDTQTGKTLPPPKTILDLIQDALLVLRDRAELNQIYRGVQKARPNTSEDSIRGVLNHAVDDGKLIRHEDHTYSLPTDKFKVYKGVSISFTAKLPFEGVVSVPSEGMILGNELLLPLKQKEEDLEAEFVQNYKRVLGQGTHYLPVKTLVGGQIKKVTDGLLIDLNDQNHPSFWIVEVELSSHSMERHIQTQVVGFLQALRDEKTLGALVNTIHPKLVHTNDEDWSQQFFIPAYVRHEFPESFKFLYSLLHRKCGLLIVIDRMTPKLRDIAHFFSDKRPVKVIEFKTFKRGGELIHTFSQPDLSQRD